VCSLACFQHSLVKSLIKNFMKWCYTFMTVDRRVVLIEPVLICGLDILHEVVLHFHDCGSGSGFDRARLNLWLRYSTLCYKTL
jgi:hypothetical protein